MGRNVGVSANAVPSVKVAQVWPSATQRVVNTLHVRAHESFPHLIEDIEIHWQF